MEDRITELEIKLALQDDLLDTLNRTVAEQQLQISRMYGELVSLSQYIRSMELPGGRSKPEDEIPPHY